MLPRLPRRVALATSAVLLVSAVAVSPASAGGGTATCSYTASTGALSATFSVAADGYHAWAWRTGRKALAGGIADLVAAEGPFTKIATTRRNLSGVIKFGVVSVDDPTVYEYVTCTSS